MSLSKRDCEGRKSLRRRERRLFNRLLAAGLAEVNARQQRKNAVERLMAVDGVSMLSSDEEE